MRWELGWSGRWVIGLVALALLSHCGGDMEMEERTAEETPRVTSTTVQLLGTVEPVSPLPPECMPRLETFVFGAEPREDGFVSRDAPDQSFGGEPALLVDGSPRLESFLKFYVSTEGMRVRDATLELSAFDPTSNGPVLYRASNEWSEELTWNTRPSLLDGPLGNLGAISSGTRVSYDVTGVVTSEGDYSFGLIPESSNGVDFYSREVTRRELRPTLRLTLETPLFCSYRGAGGGLTRWVRQSGGRGNERLHALATYPEGGFLAAGLFGDASFPEGEGLALARYSVEGFVLWSRVVVTHDVLASDLTLTRTGDILVVGTYEGSPDLGAGRLPTVPEDVTGRGLFLARFSPTGEPVWTRGFVATDASGVPLPVFLVEVATDTEGSLIVTGSFQGQMSLGGDVLSSGPTIDPALGPPVAGFLAKFSGDGRHLWSRAFEASDTTRTTGGDAVATDAGDNLIVAGRASPRTDLGGGPLGEYAPFLAKYSPSGSLLWSRVFSGAEGGITDVRPQGEDRVVFIGNLAGTFTFAGETYSSPPFLPDGFLGALTSTGADLWIRDLGLDVRLHELAVSEDGSLTVLGRGLGEFDVGGGPLGVDLRVILLPFVARFSREGEHRWSRAFAQGFSPHLGLHPGGAVLLGGDFGPRSVEVDGRVFTPRGESDLLYLELTSSPEESVLRP